jgi:hypothetical protein
MRTCQAFSLFTLIMLAAGVASAGIPKAECPESLKNLDFGAYVAEASSDDIANMLDTAQTFAGDATPARHLSGDAMAYRLGNVVFDRAAAKYGQSFTGSFRAPFW